MVYYSGKSQILVINGIDYEFLYMDEQGVMYIQLYDGGAQSYRIEDAVWQ